MGQIRTRRRGKQGKGMANPERLLRHVWKQAKERRAMPAGKKKANFLDLPKGGRARAGYQGAQEVEWE